MSSAPSSPLDQVNRPVWTRDVRLFEAEGWGDRGELQALLHIADEVRGAALLDLGVGAGRTTPLLRLLSADYLALDYTPEMVEACRRRHPGARVEQGDARELDGVADASQALVFFSLNGIDAVDHDDRQRVLAAVQRVLRPGGLFVFSTLNKDGPLFRTDPSTAPDISWEPGSLLPRSPERESPVDVPQDAFAAVRNWRRLRGQAIDADGWGVAPFAAHQFGLLTHFVTLAYQRDELRAHGMELETAFDCHGERVRDDASQAMYVNIVARRR